VFEEADNFFPDFPSLCFCITRSGRIVSSFASIHFDECLKPENKQLIETNMIVNLLTSFSMLPALTASVRQLVCFGGHGVTVVLVFFGFMLRTKSGSSQKSL
jgi:hypothetical protein